MAAVQKRNHSFRVLFCYHGKRHTLNLGKVTPDEADRKAGQIDYLLLRLKQGLISMPAGVTVEDFMLHDGQATAQEEPARSGPVTFATVRQHYLETHRHGAMEEGSLATVELHLRHFETTLGQLFPLQDLSLADLQGHVNRRAGKKYRGRRLSPTTLKKEMASFRATWNWAAHTGLVRGPFPNKGLVYPKADEKPPFMTLGEIERKVTPALSNAEQAQLWSSLYLARAELEELLGHVKDHAAHRWVYPMFVFAAHTGARRSEMLRVLVSDVDLENGTVLIREKKRSRTQRTTRRVPLTPFLATVLRAWLGQHPGGQHLFCHDAEVCRSKKRSRTTGYTWGKRRPTSPSGRAALVRRRQLPALSGLTKKEAHDHFRRSLARSRWAVVRGWHCFRHSFISLCASQGTDQRLIDEWVGHQTEEQRKRYRHLLPSTQRAAIQLVFGG
jgi:integrase